MSTIVDLPEPTKKRMIQLLQILKSWPSEKITSMAISNATGWKDSLIRHDLWLVGFHKGVSNGYYVKELIEVLEQILGLESHLEAENQISVKKNCCIVGLGRLGAALLDENLVEGSPFVIKAGFDSNVNRVEILRSTFPLYPASEMQFVIRKEKIEYAVLTVPSKDAQQMTDRLVTSGIKGIVNMTNLILKVPENIKVENISILNALNLVI
ncbi:MAG: hypothetical protein MJ179_09860 [Treponema sp.]|nr:hypothetical protein [Treponema sp.]